VGLRAVLDTETTGKILSRLPGIELPSLGRPAHKFDLRQGQRTFPLTSVSRPALGPTQPPVQWVPGVLSPGQSSAGK
jgi:hypothetical protein